MTLYQFILMRKTIQRHPERIPLMDSDTLGRLKIAYLNLRQSILEKGAPPMSEEDVIAEQRITTQLGNLARIWARQAEEFYDTNYPEGDDPPATPNDGESGPVSKE